jgi:hypothetical protein
MIEHGYHWIETTTVTELQQGVRKFQRGTPKPEDSVRDRITALADELERHAERLRELLK